MPIPGHTSCAPARPSESPRPPFADTIPNLQADPCLHIPGAGPARKLDFMVYDPYGTVCVLA